MSDFVEAASYPIRGGNQLEALIAGMQAFDSICRAVDAAAAFPASRCFVENKAGSCVCRTPVSTSAMISARFGTFSIFCRRVRALGSRASNTIDPGAACEQRSRPVP